MITFPFIRFSLFSKQPLNLEALARPASRPACSWMNGRIVRVDVRQKLGQGDELFECAKRALLNWHMFDIGWVKITPTDIAAHAGQIYGVVFRNCGLSVISVARLSRIIEENDNSFPSITLVCRTTSRHALYGVERFSVMCDLETSEVSFRLRSWSRIAPIFLPAGFALRQTQRKFAADACSAMQKAVARN